MFNGKILLAWKANLDIQIVLEPYGCASYVVGYISKSQRGMSAQLEAAAKEARKGNSDIKKQVRHIGNVFSNCVEVGAQEAVYLALQIPLTKGTREVVYINTCASRERVFLLKPKSVLDELLAESTNIESDNIVQRYSKRPKQLQKFCLADYVSQVDIIYPKGNKLPDKVEYRNDDSISDENSSDENENSEDEEMVENGKIASDLIHIAKNGTKYKYRKVPKVIRYVKLCTHDQDLRIRKFCIREQKYFLLCVHMAFKDQQNLSKVEILFYKTNSSFLELRTCLNILFGSCK